MEKAGWRPRESRAPQGLTSAAPPALGDSSREKAEDPPSRTEEHLTTQPRCVQTPFLAVLSGKPRRWRTCLPPHSTVGIGNSTGEATSITIVPASAIQLRWFDFMKNALTLSVLPGRFAVCRQGPEDEIPGWAWGGSFVSITRAPGELSIVCAEENVPAHVPAERGRRLLGVRGPLEFSLTGILAALAEPLAAAGISIFSISTFETDYVLVADAVVEQAIAVLEQAGHTILREAST